MVVLDQRQEHTVHRAADKFHFAVTGYRRLLYYRFRSLPDAHLAHDVKNSVHDLIAEGSVDIMSLSHFQYQCGNAQQIQGMRQGGFVHRGGGIHPDHIGVGHFRIGKQGLGEILAESYLWDLPHENITGVQIHADIRSDDGIHHCCSDPFHHIPRSISREHTVHIHLQSRHRAARHIDP